MMRRMIFLFVSVGLSLLSFAAGKSTPIPEARQAEIKAAEKEFARRVILDPIEHAFQSETAETQTRFKDVMQTAKDTLYFFSAGSFGVYREYIGRGAVSAYYKAGCVYPLPIAFAYSSLLKQTEDIQKAFGDAHAALESDPRWDAWTRGIFYAYMGVGTNAESNLVETVKARRLKALREILTNMNCTSNEIGIVYNYIRFIDRDGEIEPVINEVKSAGVQFDPWLDLMLQAYIARAKAWKARGTGYANTVTDEGWKIYGEEIKKVLPLAEKAYLMRPDLVYSCCLALQTVYGNEPAQRLWFERLRACQPDNLDGYLSLIHGLRPRWGGSTSKMAQFLMDNIEKREFNTLVPLLAYEQLVRAVFIDEGGIRLKPDQKPNIAHFVREYHDAFDPYFEGYRQSGIIGGLSYIEKVHLYIALSDLAWRLANSDELLYWYDQFVKTGMPAVETYFSSGHNEYYRILDVIRKLDTAEKRNNFMRDYQDYKNGDMALHFKVKSSDVWGQLYLLVHARPKKFTKTKAGKRTFQMLAMPGRLNSTDGSPNWPLNQDTCSFDVEIIGAKVRVIQDGKVIKEESLTDGKGYQLEIKTIGGLQIEQVELEPRE